VENAIKASFYRLTNVPSASSGLRYVEIKRAVGETRPISDRTLSRALRRLIDIREIRKGNDGRYEPQHEWTRKEAVQLIKSADIMSIDAGSTVGIVGDQKAGWSFYGIPLGKPYTLRPQLRRAALEFQNRVDEILGEEARLTIDRVLKTATMRGFPAQKAREIRKMLMGIFEYWERLRMKQLDAFAWIQILEHLAPGAFSQLLTKLLKPPPGIENDLAAGIPLESSFVNRRNEWISYFARLQQEDEGMIREEWDDFVQGVREGTRLMEEFRSSLRASDWQSFGKRWSSVISTRYWLTAVVR